MAFAARRSFKKRARSLAAGLGVRRPLHVRGLVVDRCTYHTLTSPELTARAAGEKENGGCGRYPPAMPLVFKADSKASALDPMTEEISRWLVAADGEFMRYSSDPRTREEGRLEGGIRDGPGRGFPPGCRRRRCTAAPDQPVLWVAPGK